MIRDDLVFTARVLRRYKGYTVAAIVTLALGIGATTAVFGVIDATLLRPLPYSEPDRLVALNSARTDPRGVDQPFLLSQIELLTWRASTLLESIESIEPRTVALTGRGEPEVLDAGAVTEGFFRTLRHAPLIGRTFSAEEERQNAGVVVLSHALWANRFSSNSEILGHTITLGGRPHVVIGVMPERFTLPFAPSSVWTPLNPAINAATQNNRLMFTVARLRENVTTTQAQSELAALSARLGTQWPISHRDTKPVVRVLHEALFGQRAQALWLLGIAVGGLLTLACANVANLTLGHLSARQGELATRAVLGASAARIVRLLVLQTGALAIVGAILALTAIAVALPSLVALYNADGQALVSFGVDWRVGMVSLVVVAGTIVLCAVLPAWKILRASAHGEGLRMAATRFSAGRWERSLRATLVAAQVGIAVALLCVSGTLLTSLKTVLAVSPGFSPDRVLTMQMMLPPAIYPDLAARANVVRRMLEHVQQVPGVSAVGTTQSTFLPNQSMMTLMHIERINENANEAAPVNIRHITPGYFDALRIPVVDGRPIDIRDQLGFPNVCMVSSAFAKAFFPNGGAVGRRVRRAGPNVVWMTVVGVAADVRDYGLVTDPGPTLYIPYLQLNTATARVSLVARTEGDPTRMAGSVRQAIWRVDPNQPIDRIASLDDVLLEGASAERFRTVLVALFAIVGLILSVVGVYAVTSASVTARTFEASLRLALGARPVSVATDMLRQASVPIGMGVVAGIVMSVLASRLIAGLLYQTSANDARIIAAAAATMSICALAAASWQSRRLARVSPALGLRGQA